MIQFLTSVTRFTYCNVFFHSLAKWLRGDIN